MTAIRDRNPAPLISPVSAPAAPGHHHYPAGPRFTSVLHAALQEIEPPENDDVPRIESLPPHPHAGPLIVAGIVLPAPLPR